MKMLVKPNEFGIFADANGNSMTSSLYVAEFFGKEHKHVLRDIENLDCSENFRQSNFGLTSYKDEQGKKRPCINMTRDGFWYLSMGYRGKKAAAIKERFIEKFNEMEKYIRTLNVVKNDFADLTDTIRDVFGADAPSYVYTNEINLINKLVTGKTTKDFRSEHNIPKGESIFPYLSIEQLSLLDKLQKVDIGLLTVCNYADRKAHLTEYCTKLRKHSVYA